MNMMNGPSALDVKRFDLLALITAGSASDASDGWTIIGECFNIKPIITIRVIHEYLMKHFSIFSPWVNNCVGERNQKYFLQFLVYVGMLAVYSIILIVLSWMAETDPDISMADAQAKMLHSVILLLESGLFGLFVIAIMVDQLHAILCKLKHLSVKIINLILQMMKQRLNNFKCAAVTDPIDPNSRSWRKFAATEVTRLAGFSHAPASTIANTMFLS